MKANYHTHSKWCHHGGGEISDYIEEALKFGFEQLAITEHVPHLDRPTWIKEDEFLPFDADLNRCVSLYSDRIRVIKGFECEYINKTCVLDLYKRYKEDYGYELLIMGQHCAGDNGEHNMFFAKDSEVIKRYFEDVVEGLHTGLFAYLAHPDVCLIDYEPGFDKVCEEGFKMVFQACEELKIPVEYNANGLRNHKVYPSKEVFELSKNYDLTYMIGSDAHDPSLLCDWAVEESEKILKDMNIEVTEILPAGLIP